MSQAELWLEIVTDDPRAAASHLQDHGVTRCDEIEDPGGTTSFWIVRSGLSYRAPRSSWRENQRDRTNALPQRKNSGSHR